MHSETGQLPWRKVSASHWGSGGATSADGELTLVTAILGQRPQRPGSHVDATFLRFSCHTPRVTGEVSIATSALRTMKYEHSPSLVRKEANGLDYVRYVLERVCGCLSDMVHLSSCPH